jgi:small GTP-binding protein
MESPETALRLMTPTFEGLSGGLRVDLRQYEAAKFRLAEILRSAAAAADGDGLKDRARDLFVRLAEDRFNLVVVGRFNRGKTSLMNALLGTNRLPVGIVPLTSVITTVAYGSKEIVRIEYEGRRLAEEVPLEALPDYVTQRGNPGNVRGLRQARVELPVELLRRGFHFIDTPGLGSAIGENTRTTSAFLPEADAVLLVTSCDSPLTSEEVRALESVTRSLRRVFIVLNKHDLVSLGERREAVAYVREQTARLLPGERPPIFSVSARDGLEAKLSHDGERLRASGLPELEEALIRFLTAEKSREFLRMTGERIAAFLRDLPDAPGLPLLRRRLDALRPMPAHGVIRRTVRFSDEPGEIPVAQDRSCDVCEQVGRRVFEFLCRFQYDLGVSQESRQALARTGGLCSLHTWQYEAVASPHGICAGYPAVLDRLASDLRALAAESVSLRRIVGALGALLPSEESCPVCRVRAAAETEALAALAGRGKEGAEPFSVLCLPHLRLAAGATADAAAVRALLRREAVLLERLCEDMRRYALKRDAVRRALLSEEEQSAAARALRMVAGHRNVVAPWRVQ